MLLPLRDFGGTTAEFYDGSRYGLRVGIGGHAKLRFGIGGIRMAGDLGYTYLYGHGAATSGVGTIDLVGRVFALRLGPEFQFPLTASGVGAYVGGNIALNNLGFDITFTDVPGVARPTEDYISNSAARIGAGLTGGILVPVASGITVDVGVGFNFVNLLGAEWEDRDPVGDNRDDSYLALNDAVDPHFAPNSSTHFIGHSRHLQTAQLTVTVMFGN